MRVPYYTFETNNFNSVNKTNCLIYCNCGAGIIPEEKQNEIGTLLKELNTTVFELHDLCAFSVNEADFLNSLEKEYNKKYIVACYPRAITHMFAQNNIKLTNYEVLNFRELSVQKIRELLEESNSQSESEKAYRVEKSTLEVPAWYPVIDHERCTLCGQCARFCVFGVYRYNKKSLEVVNPLSCKNNCPACGRTCPASAIMFPRLPEKSPLSGARPENKTTGNEVPKKEGLFVLLNERNNVRRNIFRNDEIQLAEEEKRKAIAEFKKGLKNK